MKGIGTRKEQLELWKHKQYELGAMLSPECCWCREERSSRRQDRGFHPVRTEDCRKGELVLPHL